VAGPNRDYLLVDGYNIIFAWDELKSIALVSLEDARKRLLDILSDFQGFSGINIFVVFDAHMVKDNVGATEYYDDLTVVFTKEFESADNYIERCVGLFSKKHKVRVATSDSLEQIMVISRGAQRISAADLLNEVKAAKIEQTVNYIEKRPVKRNPLFDSLDEDMKRAFEKMRRQKN
jgi:predicted RNA-binding protein with PIN domain